MTTPDPATLRWAADYTAASAEEIQATALELLREGKPRRARYQAEQSEALYQAARDLHERATGEEDRAALRDMADNGHEGGLYTAMTVDEAAERVSEYRREHP